MTWAFLLAVATGGCAHADRTVSKLDRLTAACAVTPPPPESGAPLIYVATTRLPHCRAGKATALTIHRAADMRYATTLTTPAPILLTTPDAWRTSVTKDIAAGGGGVMLFVHGYNNGSDEVLGRARKLRTLTRFSGPIVALIWPSQESVVRYGWDEENARWTQRRANALLAELATMSTSVTIVAHSMGNRIALDALIDLQRTQPSRAANVNRLIMASPDIDRDVFEDDIVPQVATAGRTITVYASRADQALRASWGFHGYPRIGDTACRIGGLFGRSSDDCYIRKPAAGLSIVDTSRVSSKGLGHADFLESSAVMADLQLVVHCRAGVDRGAPTGANVYKLPLKARPACIGS